MGGSTTNSVELPGTSPSSPVEAVGGVLILGSPAASSKAPPPLRVPPGLGDPVKPARTDDIVAPL